MAHGLTKDWAYFTLQYNTELPKIIFLDIYHHFKFATHVELQMVLH
jgi:hypothetical protein